MSATTMGALFYCERAPIRTLFADQIQRYLMLILPMSLTITEPLVYVVVTRARPFLPTP